MALFGLKKSEKKVVKAVKAPKKVAVAGAVSTASYAHLINRPRVTEKAAVMNEAHNVFTFEVDMTASKGKIAHAIKELYKVTPIKVNIVRLPAKAVFVRGKRGMQRAIKKALVYLKKGDKIEA